MDWDSIVIMTEYSNNPYNLWHKKGSMTSESDAAILIEKQARPSIQIAAGHAATAPQTPLEQLHRALHTSAGKATDAEEGIAGPSWPRTLNGWLNDLSSASRNIDHQHAGHLQLQAPAAVDDQLDELSTEKPAEQPDAQPVEQPRVAVGGEKPRSTASSKCVSSPAPTPRSPAQTLSHMHHPCPGTTELMHIEGNVVL